MSTGGHSGSPAGKGGDLPPAIAEVAKFWERGDTPAAARLLRRLLLESPGTAQLHVLGAAFTGLSNPQAARAAFARATHIAPGDGKIWRDYGLFLQNLGDPQQSCLAMGNAYIRGVREPQVLISIARHLVDARVTLNLPDGRKRTALQLLDELFTAQPKLRQEHQDDFVNALSVGPYVRGDGVTAARLCSAFESGAVRRVKLAAYAIDFLKDSAAWPTLSELETAAKGGSDLIPALRRLSRHDVLLAVIEAVPVPDAELEDRLAVLRKALLGLAANPGLRDPSVLRVARAIAIQCTLNEYVFEESAVEAERIVLLVDEATSDLQAGRRPRSLAVTMIAAYRHLGSVLPDLEAVHLARAGEQDRLMQLHISDPAVEAGLAATLPVLTPITDSTSSTVRSQYESNPYPTWTAARTRFDRVTPREAIAQQLRTITADAIPLADECTILVAGCGTGQEPIEMVSKMRTSRMLAVDLSRRSLAYAKRKAGELGISAIEFAQADLLELGTLDERFDIIISVGVLHHTRDMRESWRVLRRLLKPRGVMEIGLYSRIARRGIAEAREMIAAAGIPSSNEAMRAFRRALRNERPELYEQLAASPDFHTLSQFRDLLFHSRETVHDLHEIEEMLAELQLELLGFATEMNTALAYRSRFPDDPRMTSIENWHQFECDNPGTFGHMYKFWALSRT